MMDPFGQAISLVGIENDRNNPNGMEVNPEVSEWDWHGAGMKLTSSVAENLKGKLADKESEKEGRVCYIYADISIGWDINGNKGGMRILYMSKDNVLGSTDNPIKFMPSVGSGHYDGDPQQLTEEGIRNIHSSRRTVGTTRGDINISATYCILCFCSQDNADWYLNKARINSNPEYDEDTNRLRHNSLTNKLYNRDNLAQFHLPVEDCGIESAHINFDWTEGSYDKNAGQYINVTTEVNNY